MRAPLMRRDQIIIANLSGRGDKEASQAAEFFARREEAVAADGKRRAVHRSEESLSTETQFG